MSWFHMFEGDLFQKFDQSSKAAIQKVLGEVKGDAPMGLKEHARDQSKLSLEEAKVALQETIEAAREALTIQQKQISHCLAPHIQTRLMGRYDQAARERGKGSAARQKVLVPRIRLEVPYSIILTTMAHNTGRISQVSG